jgi:class 3 adenylate cyclase
MRAYQHACVGVITRFDGHVAKYLGDGLLVYFGYPTAHEDGTVRAVRAGLKIVEAMQNAEGSTPRLPSEQNDVLKDAAERPVRVDRSFKAGLQVRIGIHTGLVVAGEMGSGAYREPLAIVGETPNTERRVPTARHNSTIGRSAIFTPS